MTRSTLLRCTRLRYSVTTEVVGPASSICTISIFEPPNPTLPYGAGPLPAFSSSTMKSAEFFAGTPNGEAAGPERNITKPTLTGCWASTPPDAAASTPATASFFRPCMGFSSWFACPAAPLVLRWRRRILRSQFAAGARGRSSRTRPREARLERMPQTLFHLAALPVGPEEPAAPENRGRVHQHAQPPADHHPLRPHPVRRYGQVHREERGDDDDVLVQVNIEASQFA